MRQIKGGTPMAVIVGVAALAVLWVVCHYF